MRAVEEEARGLERDITALAAEMQEKIVEITNRYGTENYPVEEFSITPRRSDIFDVRIYLQWEPVLDFSNLKEQEVIP